MRANVLGAWNTFTWINLDIIFSKVNPNPPWGTSLENPIQTGAFCETEEQFPGNLFVRPYSIGLGQVLYVMGGCRLGNLPHSTADSMTLWPPMEDNFVSVSSRTGVLHWTVSLSPLTIPLLLSTSLPPKCLFQQHMQPFTGWNYLITVGGNKGIW